VIRGFARKSSSTIGNFWADVVRATLYVFLPLSLIGGVLFVALGVPQNFSPYAVATTLEGGRQTLALGPVASQEIIKRSARPSRGKSRARHLSPERLRALVSEHESGPSSVSSVSRA
jgi:K+-transporting ATPase ATPase A chain